ncbi:hypothetical protein HJD18_06190 [Thermoleophilia bacterium SCSIO 60948]|nr:hypothetical protein HJD18_06190 [Thermoleophilia bacterium SCSIO 60948]
MISHRFGTPARRRLLAVFALLTASLAVLVPSAHAADPTAELRVVGDEGTIETGTWYVLPKGRISAPLAANAGNCTPRPKPKRESYPQRSALGVALNGAALDPDLGATRIQSYDFGPLICRYAGIIGEEFNPDTGEYSGWNFYVDFVGGSSSADLAKVRGGDRVLWALGDETLPNPLRLRGIEPSSDGTVTATVEEIGFDGSPSPVTGATIEGASSQTDNGDGTYDLELPDGRTDLTATNGSDIESNVVEACSEAGGADCPDAFGRTIVGTSGADDIRATAGDDVVRSGGGNDTVNAAAGGADRVNCGAGRKDVVIAERGDAARTSNCEKVRRARR